MREMLAFLVFITLSSCAQDESVINTILPNGKVQSYDGSLDYISYVPLMTKEGVLLSHIRKLVVHPDHFIFLHSNSSNIFFYDHDGDYEFMIKKGIGGPLEMLNPSDIALGDRNSLLIADSEKNAILKLDIETREITKEWKLESTPFNLATHGKDIILFTNDFDKGPLKIVSDFDFDDMKSTKSNATFNMVVSSKPTASNNSATLILGSFSDTIYSYDKGSLQKAYTLGFEESALGNTESSIISQNVMSRNLAAFSEIILPAGALLKFNNKLIIPLINEERGFIAYDMILSKATIGNKNSVENMIIWSRDRNHPVTFTRDEKYHYSAVIPDANFYNYILRNPELVGEENLKIIKELSEIKFENPIIIKFKVAPSFMDIL